MLRVIGVRSRITQTMSNGCRALDDSVGVREMVVKYTDGRPRIQHRPIRERKSDVLVASGAIFLARRIGWHFRLDLPAEQLYLLGK